MLSNSISPVNWQIYCLPVEPNDEYFAVKGLETQTRNWKLTPRKANRRKAKTKVKLKSGTNAWQTVPCRVNAKQLSRFGTEEEEAKRV